MGVSENGQLLIIIVHYAENNNCNNGNMMNDKWIWGYTPAFITPWKGSFAEHHFCVVNPGIGKSGRNA
jgi:hypothetical protein